MEDLNYKYQYTKDEAEQLLKSMRLIMDFACIVTADEIEGRYESNAKFKNDSGYKLLKRTKPCEICISEQVLKEKKDLTKLEFVDGECYQFFARYIIVDGQECSFEIAKKISEKTFIDSDGYKQLVEKVTQSKTRMYQDALTGVYNRSYYESVEKYNKKPAGIAMIDIDDFKLCNDIYGHNAGDEALKTVVNIIQNNVRSDDKIIRFGGDEILLILEGIQADSFKRKLERIRVQTYSTKVKGYSKLQLSLSIGAVISTDQSREDSILIADRFMYLAKVHENKVITSWDEYEERAAIEREAMKEKPLVLIVDDSEMNRLLLSGILEEKYRIIEARDGEEAIEKIEEYRNELSLVLLDIVMPKMDGFGVLEYLNVNEIIQDIPVIMISSMNEDSAIRRCYELGISDYIRRPFSQDVVVTRVKNIVRLYQKQRKLQAEIREQVEERERNSRVVMSIISHVVENRNGESGPHVIHVEQITEILLDKLTEMTDVYNLTKEDKKEIVLASSLHDIGKIGIDEKILNKPGKLTTEEYEIMKTHTTIGAAMVRQVQLEEDDSLIQYVYEICRWHHEKWDGKGYPDGLHGNYIPISAQVVSIADVYDALVSERVYKKGYSHEKAIQMILNGECGEFNPLLKECLLSCQEKIRLIEAKNAKQKGW